MPVPVYVLNLPRDADRRALAEAELLRVGLDAAFVPGVDGAALGPEDMARYDGRRCRAIYGLDMLPSELGCYLGHERVIRRILDDGHDVALVLEDDIRLDDDLPAILADLVAGPRPWMVVRLSGMRPRKTERAVARRQPVRAIGRRHALYQLDVSVPGAQGYVVTAEGARRILDYSARIGLPWDHALDRFWEHGIEPWVVYPFPVHHREDVASVIGVRDPRRRYQQGGLALWRRRANRWRDSVMRRWYAARHLRPGDGA